MDCDFRVLRLFLKVPWVGLQYVIVVFPDHPHLFCFNGDQQPSPFWFVVCFSILFSTIWLGSYTVDCAYSQATIRTGTKSVFANKDTIFQ